METFEWLLHTPSLNFAWVGEGYWLGVKSVPQKLPKKNNNNNINGSIIIITKIATKDLLVAHVSHFCQ